MQKRQNLRNIAIQQRCFTPQQQHVQIASPGNFARTAIDNDFSEVV
ncbi:MAG: hypothetical protein H6629_13675 [Calditrichae bacterium]|nr:hypothetical protein [Calditrichia bacterium]